MYINAGTKDPVECTFEFPIEKDNVVTKLTAEIDDKLIEAKIKQKEVAKEQYSDAIASGKVAILATKEKKND